MNDYGNSNYYDDYRSDEHPGRGEWVVIYCDNDNDDYFDNYNYNNEYHDSDNYYDNDNDKSN